jgi:hypothetical protein
MATRACQEGWCNFTVGSKTVYVRKDNVVQVQSRLIGPPAPRNECTIKVIANGKLVEYKPDDCHVFISRYIEKEVVVRVYQPVE